jgi:hypothetical protein
MSGHEQKGSQTVIHRPDFVELSPFIEMGSYIFFKEFV